MHTKRYAIGRASVYECGGVTAFVQRGAECRVRLLLTTPGTPRVLATGEGVGATCAMAFVAARLNLRAPRVTGRQMELFAGVGNG